MGALTDALLQATLAPVEDGKEAAAYRRLGAAAPELLDWLLEGTAELSARRGSVETAATLFLQLAAPPPPHPPEPRRGRLRAGELFVPSVAQALLPWLCRPRPSADDTQAEQHEAEHANP